MSQDIFLVSAEAELKRMSRLMNRASSTYWKLHDRTTKYALSVYALYLMNRRGYDTLLDTIQDYKQGRIIGE